MNNTILYTLFQDNPEIPTEISRFCKSLPEYVHAEQEYQQVVDELAQLLGFTRYAHFEALLNRYWAIENQAYYLFGLGLRHTLLRELGGVS